MSDGIVSGIQALSIAGLWAVRDRFDGRVFRLLVLSVLFSIATEMSAFVYTDAFVYNSVVGHSLKVVSFFLLYKAVIQTGLVRPYALLFRNLQASALVVRTARDLLETQVSARTEELRMANQRLEEELAERRRASAMRELMLDLHHLTQSADTVRDLLTAVSRFLQARFGCDEDVGSQAWRFSHDCGRRGDFRSDFEGAIRSSGRTRMALNGGGPKLALSTRKGTLKLTSR